MFVKHQHTHTHTHTHTHSVGLALDGRESESSAGEKYPYKPSLSTTHTHTHTVLDWRWMAGNQRVLRGEVSLQTIPEYDSQPQQQSGPGLHQPSSLRGGPQTTTPHLTSDTGLLQLGLIDPQTTSALYYVLLPASPPLTHTLTTPSSPTFPRPPISHPLGTQVHVSQGAQSQPEVRGHEDDVTPDHAHTHTQWIHAECERLRCPPDNTHGTRNVPEASYTTHVAIECIEHACDHTASAGKNIDKSAKSCNSRMKPMLAERISKYTHLSQVLKNACCFVLPVVFIIHLFVSLSVRMSLSPARYYSTTLNTLQAKSHYSGSWLP